MFAGKHGWQQARDMWAHCHGQGEGHGHGHGHGRHRHGGHGGGQPFGVRRPLRFLAHRLELDDDQVEELAHILSDIKTERAQAEVDDQRAIAAFADAVAVDSFDRNKAEEGGTIRVKSSERLREEVSRTLERTHALLTPEQRKKLAYLLRSGQLTI
jgi:Spy/CpxP family protein refolding chaperone